MENIQAITQAAVLEEIRQVLTLCRKAVKQLGFYGYLPEIIGWLEEVEHNIVSDCLPKRGGRMRSPAGAIGRVVLEDYAFSRSDLGVAIINVGHHYDSLPDG